MSQPIIRLMAPSRGTAFWSGPPGCEIVTGEDWIEAVAACWRSGTQPPVDVVWTLDVVRKQGTLDVKMVTSHRKVGWAYAARSRATGESRIVGDLIVWETVTAHLR